MTNLDKLFQVNKGNRTDKQYELAFDEIALDAGGLRVSDLYPEIAGKGKNSDYYFPSKGMIAELKCRRHLTDINKTYEANLNKYIYLNKGKHPRGIRNLNEQAMARLVFDAFKGARSVLEKGDKQNRVTKNYFEKRGIKISHSAIIALNCDDYNFTPGIFVKSFGDVIGHMQREGWLKETKIFMFASLDMNLVRNGAEAAHGFSVTQAFYEADGSDRISLEDCGEFLNLEIHKSMCKLVHSALTKTGHKGLTHPDGTEKPLTDFEELEYDGTKITYNP